MRKDDISAKYTDKAQTKAVEDVQTANQTYHDNSACKDEKSQDSSVDIEKARSVVNDTAAHPDDEEKEAVAQFNNSAPDIFPAAEGGVHEEIWTEDTQNKLEQKNIFVGECNISETLTVKVYKHRYGCHAERAVNCKKCCSGIDNSTHTCCSVYFIRQDQTGKLYYHFKEYSPYKVREFLEDSDYDVSGRDRIISQMKWIFQSTEEKLYLSVLKAESHTAYTADWRFNHADEDFVKEKSKEFGLSVETTKHIAKLLCSIITSYSDSDYGYNSITDRLKLSMRDYPVSYINAIYRYNGQIRYLYCFSDSSPTYHTGSVTVFCRYIGIEKVNLKWEDIKRKCEDVPYTVCDLSLDSHFEEDCEIAVYPGREPEMNYSYSNVIYLREPFGEKNNYMVFSGSFINDDWDFQKVR